MQSFKKYLAVWMILGTLLAPIQVQAEEVESVKVESQESVDKISEKKALTGTDLILFLCMNAFIIVFCRD